MCPEEIPLLQRWLLMLLLPHSLRDEAMAALQAEFASNCHGKGPAAARAYLWSEIRALLKHGVLLHVGFFVVLEGVAKLARWLF